MAFDVSALTNYVNEQSQELITAAQFQGETAKLAQIQTGIKSAAALQILDTTANMLDGSGCGFTGTDGAVFSQRIITTGAVKFEPKWCPKDLQPKWTQLLLKKGQDYTEADIPSKIIDLYVQKINSRLEVADWQGDTGSLDDNLNKYDGLVKIIDAAAGVVSATASTYNAANARTIVKDIVSKIPAALKGDASVEIVMGYTEAEIYRQALMDANLFHVPSGMSANDLTAEGTGYKIRPVHGLDSLSRIFAFRWSNVTIGVDMEGEEDVAKMWIDGSDGETVKARFSCRRGWQIAIPSEIVEYTNV